MFCILTLLWLNQNALQLAHGVQEKLFKDMEAKRMVIQESNKVRLSRIQSAVRKDVENARSKGNATSIGEKKLSDYNRHLTDADVDIREWDTGDVLTEAVSWRTSKFDMRKRIFVLVGFFAIIGTFYANRDS